MSRMYQCDAEGCDKSVPGTPIELTYYTVVEDDDEPDYNEAHFCSWVCLSSFATSSALDYPPEEEPA